MTTYFIGMHVERKQAAEYIKKYEKHRETVKKRLDNSKDEKTKERNQKYLNQLDKEIDKLKMYEESLHTEEELEARRTSDSDTSSDSSLDDGDIKFENMVMDINKLDIMVTQINENYNDNTTKFIQLLEPDRLDHKVIKRSIEEITKYNIADKKLIMEAIEDKLLYGDKKNFQKWNTLIMSKRILENGIPCKDKIDVDLIFNKSHMLNEFFIKYNELLDQKSVLNEISFSSSVGMLMDTVKRSGDKLDDKNKMLSHTVDGLMDNIRLAMENALKQENKEAVIRGSVLPPLSRLIKLALASGVVAWLINPVVALIGLVATFSMMKDLRAKERQIVLDELNTELEITDRYIEKYKNENDMKKLRECLQIQKKLLRERDRLKYKTKVDYDEKAPDSYDKDK